MFFLLQELHRYSPDLVEDNTQGTLIAGIFHIDFIQLCIFGFVYNIISFVVFCFGFLFAMGFFPNGVVGLWGVLVMYLKSYQGFNKRKMASLCKWFKPNCLMWYKVTEH